MYTAIYLGNYHSIFFKEDVYKAFNQGDDDPCRLVRNRKTAYNKAEGFRTAWQFL